MASDRNLQPTTKMPKKNKIPETAADACHSMPRLVRCPSCDGKGHVMDGDAAIMAVVGIVFSPLLLLDRNDPDGITRKVCQQCDGAGFVDPRD